MSQSIQDDLKARAAARALDFVVDGMKLGLGSGSTAALFVDLLAERVRSGCQVTCVPTSEATRRQASAAGIDLTTLDETPALDLTVDGADEFDPELRLIKGGGGALLREKIVAAASASLVIVADASKAVDRLGRFPLPVEVNVFGLGATTRLVKEAAARLGLDGEIVLRVAKTGAGPFVTDGGHCILDCHFGAIADAEQLAVSLVAIPGVVEHGLFIGLAKTVIIAEQSQTRVISARENNNPRIG